MNILFVALGYKKEDGANGINKKIKAEISSLRKKNRVYYTFIENESFCIEGAETLNEKIPQKLAFKKKMNVLENFIEMEKIELCYIRYEHFSRGSFLKLLSKIKQHKVKIIVEIPTYPYDHEYKKEFSRNYLSILIDRFYRKFLHKYVDYIATFSNDKEIFGIPCINISNGIDLEEVKLVSKKEKENESIVFTSVSSCDFWHGIDRILNSLEIYYENGGEKLLIFNIVGTGSETKKLKEIVFNSKYLGKVVNFLGFRSGEELEEIYNETDIAIGSLGIHRIGLKEVQPLKNREYTAKGIPFVIAFKDPDFVESEYVYQIPDDESLFSMDEIIKWKDKVLINPQEIRNDAEKFTWDIQMNKIMDVIKGEENETN